MYRVALLSLLMTGVMCAGCATVTKGATQSVSVVAPQGAICTLTSPAIGTRTITAPNTVVVEKGPDNIAVRCKKACYRDGNGEIPSTFEEMTAGNILIGGVIGLGVDMASGAINKYDPPDVKIAMTPLAGCGSKAKVSAR
jgi:hypothetical protein